MQNNSLQDDNERNCYYVVAIQDFFGPREPKVNLVQASSEEQARQKTRMGNPDLLKGFTDKNDAIAFLNESFGTEWSEL